MGPLISRLARGALVLLCMVASIGLSAYTSLRIITDTSDLIILLLVELFKPIAVALARGPTWYKPNVIPLVVYIGLVCVGAFFMHTFTAKLDATTLLPGQTERANRLHIEEERKALREEITVLEQRQLTANPRQIENFEKLIKKKQGELQKLPSPSISAAEAALDGAAGSVDGRGRPQTAPQTGWMDAAVHTVGQFRVLLVTELINLLILGIPAGRMNASARPPPSTGIDNSSSIQPAAAGQQPGSFVAAYRPRTTRGDIERQIQLWIPRVGDEVSGSYLVWARKLGCSKATVGSAITVLETSGEIEVRHGSAGTLLRRRRLALRVVS